MKLGSYSSLGLGVGEVHQTEPSFSKVELKLEPRVSVYLVHLY